MLNLTKWKVIVGALFLTIGSVSAETPTNYQQKSKSSSDFEPGVHGGMSAGYMLGLGDYAPDAINMEMQIYYQFNPYFGLGGTGGNSFFYDMDVKDEDGYSVIPGFVNFTADAIGILPISKKVSLSCNVGFGVGIGYNSIKTDYLLRVGPSLKMGPVALSALYNKFGEYEAMLFQIGYRF